MPTIAFLALCVALLALFFAFPTYPNYDSYYSLLWARELVEGRQLSFQAYRAPTEHPLAIAFGVVLLPLGEYADRAMVLASYASLAAVVWGLFRLGRATVGAWVGFVAGAILVANWDFVFLAVRGYLDPTYVALVVWAGVLEAERHRRGLPVLVLLVLSGLLRPEGWVLAGLYALWLAWHAEGVRRLVPLAVAALAPGLWALTDLLVTGNPLYSLTYTTGLADELGRSRSPVEVPLTGVRFLRKLDGLPVFFAASAGLVLAAVLVPTRLRVPIMLLATGFGTFLLLGLAGFSVIDRYLLVTSVVLVLFAGFLLAGFTTLAPGRARTLWRAGSVLGGAALVLLLVMRVNVASIRTELVFRAQAHAALTASLEDPAVRAARRCGPIAVPNHKLIPDARWIADVPDGGVVARADPDRSAGRERGPVLLPSSRTAVLRQSLVFADIDQPLDALPPDGARRLRTTAYYAVYGRC